MNHFSFPLAFKNTHTPFPLCIIPTPTHSTAAPKARFLITNWPLDEPGVEWVGVVMDCAGFEHAACMML